MVGRCFLKSIMIELQVVLTAPEYQLSHIPMIRRFITILDETDSSGVVCTEESEDIQSFVYREKSSGERKHPWGAPVLEMV